MVYVKKYLFAPLFLAVLAAACFSIIPFWGSTSIIFSLGLDTFLQLVILCGLVLAASLSFVLFATFASDLTLILPIVLVAGLIPIALIAYPLGLILGGGFILVLTANFLILNKSLNSYLTFQPAQILSPSVKNLTTFLIIVISFVYFLSINAQIKKEGFQIPDSLIETALKLSQPESPPTPNKQINSQLSITRAQISEQDIAELRKNPELLKQYGIEPNQLDLLNQTPEQITPVDQNLLKDTLKKQFQGIISPYQDFIAPVIAVLLFFTLSSIAAILGILLSPLIWLIFFILEKTGFLKFTTETRPVKKMVI